MAALVAVRHNQRPRRFYERLLELGKSNNGGFGCLRAQTAGMTQCNHENRNVVAP